MFRLLFAFLMLGGLVSACSSYPVVPIDTKPSAVAQTSATRAILHPVETLSALTSLDRDLKDSDLMRGQRSKLVNMSIAPVVADKRVLAAMQAVPRHSFIPTASLSVAYGDFPLSIGYGQTISQPSLVAMMTELLKIEAGDRVLEIGTGSGYQAAILRQLTDQVYTVEIVPELARTARAVLDGLGYKDINIARGDGYFGWKDYGPYDAIIVTAAPDHLPSPLVQQLKPDGGRLVIPIGPVGDVQTLWLVTRSGNETKMQRIIEVRFVPFTREKSAP